MAPSPAMEESHKGSRSPHSVGRIVRLISALVLVLFASFGAAKATAATATLEDSPPGPRCHGVQVQPGDDLQRLIDLQHRRSTFCFTAGLYRFSRTVWTADKFPILDLRAGAVLDGQHGNFGSFGGLEAPADRPGMTVLGGVFQHFGNADAQSLSALSLKRNAVVDGTDFRENFGVGLGISGDHARVSNVRTHHNGQYGLIVTHGCDGCPAPKGVIIEDSEIAFNNTRRLDPGHDAGGTKFSAGTVGLIVRHNEIHHNYGSGLWFDGSNRKAKVYENDIHDNRNWGIFYEVSYGGTKIHHNRLAGNGVGDGLANWTMNVQLLVASSDGSVGGRGGIEIYKNRIDGKAYPLGVITHAGRAVTKQVYVHDNVLILRVTSSRVGGVDDSGTGEMFSSSARNRFEDNTYRVRDPTAAYWAWGGETLTWAGWGALGHDTNGDVERIG